ncbi:MAG: flagellar hook-length control protein FliK [Oscillospiraceae bacterium]|nr:flagellar hook-length control protein FliK [Oscillospiraceae bacterium]
MQSTAVQMKTRAAQGVGQQSSAAARKNSDNSEFADPFLQLIMSLLAQTQVPDTVVQNGTDVTDASEKLGELAELFQGFPEGTEVLNMLLGGDAGTESLSAQDLGEAAIAQIEPQVSAFSLPVTSAEAGSIVTVDSGQTEIQAKLSELISLLGKSSDDSGTIAVTSDALTQLTDLLGISGRDEMRQLLKNAVIEAADDGLNSDQSGVSESVIKAKELLSDYLSQQADDEEIDVDKLQNELAKADKTSPFELQLRSAGSTADPKVMEQITDGIRQNLSLGKSEFVIKLKPEALGEITVKLVEEAGKTTLSITTASAQTAKLINNDISALRNAVAPMNVEVQYAVTASNETAGGSMQQFNMSGQQFAGQQFAGQQSFLQMSQAAQDQIGGQNAEDLFQPLQNAQMKFLSGDRLDAYI